MTIRCTSVLRRVPDALPFRFVALVPALFPNTSLHEVELVDGSDFRRRAPRGATRMMWD